MTEPDDSRASQSRQRITALTRRHVFDYLRGEDGPWSGRLGETEFLESLYDLDRLPSTDSRFTTARDDIVQHRITNPSDWPDDWVFKDPRFQLLDGPDEMLLAFLARLVHPEVRPDVDESSQQVDELNRLLGPDGWSLCTFDSLSGRPIYTPVHTQATGPLVSLPIDDDDTSKLDLVLGQTYGLLARDGEDATRDLLRLTVLTLRRDGGFYHPMPGDAWSAETYQAVLTVDHALLPAFTKTATDAIWQRLESDGQAPPSDRP
ncbi:hypothetical protein ACIO53_26200 [Streptomyces sp. NPDC087305]|uniref:AbiJ-related protein n=1 Tax=Streptomyces sp. NPDC087305 TaxID=3365781 RepID=UPI00382762E9